MSIKDTNIVKSRPFADVMQELSHTYDRDMSVLTFAAVKNLVTAAEWERITKSINSYGMDGVK